MKAAIYARVSTTNGQSPAMQLDELRDYCRRRGWEILKEYVDNGHSGARESRPALDRLMADARKRLVDAVVVYRYDRFARSLRQLVNALEEFRALGEHRIRSMGGKASHLTGITVPFIASALGVSGPYAAEIRAGRCLPHPRHWQTLARLVGVSPDMQSGPNGPTEQFRHN